MKAVLADMDDTCKLSGYWGDWTEYNCQDDNSSAAIAVSTGDESTAAVPIGWVKWEKADWRIKDVLFFFTAIQYFSAVNNYSPINKFIAIVAATVVSGYDDGRVFENDNFNIICYIMKIAVFWFKFHCNLSPPVRNTSISSNSGLAPNRG